MIIHLTVVYMFDYLQMPTALPPMPPRRPKPPMTKKLSLGSIDTSNLRNKPENRMCRRLFRQAKSLEEKGSHSITQADNVQEDLVKVAVPGRSPERSRSDSLNKLTRMKDDLNRRLKNTLISKRLLARRASDGGCTRKISVDLATTGGRRKSSFQLYDELDLDNIDRHDNNMTNSLSSMSLLNGQFTASFPLTRVPVGDLVIRVRCYKLQIIIKRPSADAVGEKSRYKYYGYIEIPIYVDHHTLEFRIEKDGGGILTIFGTMKGCRAARDRRKKSLTGCDSPDGSPTRRLLEVWQTLPCGTPEDDGLVDIAQLFRGRCYSR